MDGVAVAVAVREGVALIDGDCDEVAERVCVIVLLCVLLAVAEPLGVPDALRVVAWEGVAENVCVRVGDCVTLGVVEPLAVMDELRVWVDDAVADTLGVLETLPDPDGEGVRSDDGEPVLLGVLCDDDVLVSEAV